jgi:hypothetical protein
MIGWKHATMVKKCCHQYYFFETVQISTSLKPILIEVFTYYIQNKVVPLLNNVVVKRNYIFLLILND